MSSVRIPGVGEVPKPLAIGGIAVGLGGAYFIYKRQKASAAASTANATATQSASLTNDPYPSDGTVGNPADPNSVDPVTGETYGDESLQGLAAGGSGAVDVGTAPVAASGSSSGVTDVPDWTSQVESLLPTLGYTQAAVSAAVNAYLSGAQLTPDQAGIIRLALAEVPYPGSAPPIQVTTLAASPTPAHFGAPGGLSDTPYTTSVDLGWAPVSGASDYHFQIFTSAGALVADKTSTSTHGNIGNLKSKTAYKWRVQVLPATGTTASWSAERPFETK